MASVTKERDRERDWETASYRSERQRGPVTVRRYKVSDYDDRDDERYETTSRASHAPSRRDTEPARTDVSVREYRFERDSREDDRRSAYRERDRSTSVDRDMREIRIQRDVSRGPSTIQRERDDYDLDHYSRETEYYGRDRDDRRSPQTFIIRNEAPQPIIIRERSPAPPSPAPPQNTTTEITIREKEDHKSDNLELVERRSEATAHSGQLVRRDNEADEDYYYQRRIIRAHNPPEEEYADYSSQRRRHRERDNYSDDEIYIRRTEEYDEDPGRHRRHVLEGAVAGLGAAALYNHDRKKRGEKGGIGTYVGGAALGAAGTELYSRAHKYWDREHSRERSLERDWRGRRDWDDRDRGDSGPRARSHSRGHELAKLGALAAVGALAGYAASRSGKKKDGHRSKSRRRHRSRHRSRSRASSRGSRSSSESPRNPNHRNSTMAKAGLASAAVAGLVERARSKSRGGRSRSRLRQGLPIAAAGLGGAALAGLYENNKAKKAARKEASRSRSRSRARSVGAPETAHRGVGDDNLIEYGDDPIAPHSRHRSRSRGVDSNASNRSHRRGSPSSAESSPRRRRHHSRSQSRDAGYGEGAGAGLGGIAAYEASKRRGQRRAERERRDQEESQAATPQPEGYGFGPYAQEPPPAQPVFNATPFYPPNNQQPGYAYAPTPNFVNQDAAFQGQPQAAAQPYGYQPNAPQQEPYGGNQGGYHPTTGHVSLSSSATRAADKHNGGIPAEHDTDTIGAGADVNGGADSRSISPTSRASGSRATSEHAAVKTRAASTTLTAGERRPSKQVQFNPTPSINRYEAQTDDQSDEKVEDQSQSQGTQERSRRSGEPLDDTDDEQKETLSSSDGCGKDVGEGEQATRRSSRGSDHQQQRQGGSGDVLRRSEQRRPTSPDGESDSTINLPDRFERDGRKKPERGDHSLSDHLRDLIERRGTAGRWLLHAAAELVSARARPRSYTT